MTVVRRNPEVQSAVSAPPADTPRRVELTRYAIEQGFDQDA
jgi:hypothetical protein